MAWARLMQCEASRWAERGIDLLFPPHCPICRREPVGQPAPGRDRRIAGMPACAVCAGELSADVSRCGRCGEPGAASHGCQHCARLDHQWDRVAVLSAYAGPLREAVLRAKHPAGEGVAAALASLLVRKHADRLRSWGVDCVVPVPMHWMRRSLRGTSAADVLAARIAALLDVPWSRLLVRHRSTRMQNELPRTDRRRNVWDAFHTSRRIAGTRVLLVDDVMTTGATLAACCHGLLTGGAAAVDVAVVARADAHGSHGDA